MWVAWRTLNKGKGKTNKQTIKNGCADPRIKWQISSSPVWDPKHSMLFVMLLCLVITPTHNESVSPIEILGGSTVWWSTLLKVTITHLPLNGTQIPPSSGTCWSWLKLFLPLDHALAYTRSIHTELQRTTFL